MFHLPYDFEPAKLILRIAPTHVFLLYKMSQPGFPDGLAKPVQLVLYAFGRQFDPAVGQVPNRARDLKTGCDGFHCITKTNTLHTARVKNPHAPAIHSTIQPQCATIGPLPGGNSALP